MLLQEISGFGSRKECTHAELLKHHYGEHHRSQLIDDLQELIKKGLIEEVRIGVYRIIEIKKG